MWIRKEMTKFDDLCQDTHFFLKQMTLTKLSTSKEKKKGILFVTVSIEFFGEYFAHRITNNHLNGYLVSNQVPEFSFRIVIKI